MAFRQCQGAVPMEYHGLSLETQLWLTAPRSIISSEVTVGLLEQFNEGYGAEITHWNYSNFGPFEFNREQYENELKKFDGLVYHNH